MRQEVTDKTQKYQCINEWFLHSSAHRFIMVNMCMKFHEDTLNGFQVTERKRICDGQTDKFKGS